MIQYPETLSHVVFCLKLINSVLLNLLCVSVDLVLERWQLFLFQNFVVVVVVVVVLDYNYYVFVFCWISTMEGRRLRKPLPSQLLTERWTYM